MNIKIVLFLSISHLLYLPSVIQAAPSGPSINARPFLYLIRQINELTEAQNALNNRVVMLESSVTDLQSSLSDAQTTIASLQSELALSQEQIAALQSNSVLELDGMLTLDTSSGYATAVLSGANLQVVNGEGVTESINGLGNIFVGYNAPGFFLEIDPDGDIKTCSDGQYLIQSECELNDGIWANSHKTGSHNVVIGDHHNYSQYVGLVVGENNALRAPNSSASAGRRNQVTREYASICGGRDNYATAFFATVSGGRDNLASGSFSHVSGGENNVAASLSSSVTGGDMNTASGQLSTVTGGSNNQAVGYASNISGGASNIANDENSNISGGVVNVANGRASSILGGHSQTTTLDEETIPALP